MTRLCISIKAAAEQMTRRHHGDAVRSADDAGVHAQDRVFHFGPWQPARPPMYLLHDLYTRMEHDFLHTLDRGSRAEQGGCFVLPYA